MLDGVNSISTEPETRIQQMLEQLNAQAIQIEAQDEQVKQQNTELMELAQRCNDLQQRLDMNNQEWQQKLDARLETNNQEWNQKLCELNHQRDLELALLQELCQQRIELNNNLISQLEIERGEKVGLTSTVRILEARIKEAEEKADNYWHMYLDYQSSREPDWSGYGT